MKFVVHWFGVKRPQFETYYALLQVKYGAEKIHAERIPNKILIQADAAVAPLLLADNELSPPIEPYESHIHSRCQLLEPHARPPKRQASNEEQASVAETPSNAPDVRQHVGKQYPFLKAIGEFTNEPSLESFKFLSFPNKFLKGHILELVMLDTWHRHSPDLCAISALVQSVAQVELKTTVNLKSVRERLQRLVRATRNVYNGCRSKRQTEADAASKKLNTTLHEEFTLTRVEADVPLSDANCKLKKAAKIELKRDNRLATNASKCKKLMQCIAVELRNENKKLQAASHKAQERQSRAEALLKTAVQDAVRKTKQKANDDAVALKLKEQINRIKEKANDDIVALKAASKEVLQLKEQCAEEVLQLKQQCAEGVLQLKEQCAEEVLQLKEQCAASLESKAEEVLHFKRRCALLNNSFNNANNLLVEGMRDTSTTREATKREIKEIKKKVKVNNCCCKGESED